MIDAVRFSCLILSVSPCCLLTSSICTYIGRRRIQRHAQTRQYNSFASWTIPAPTSHKNERFKEGNKNLMDPLYLHFVRLRFTPKMIDVAQVNLY